MIQSNVLKIKSKCCSCNNNLSVECTIFGDDTFIGMIKANIGLSTGKTIKPYEMKIMGTYIKFLNKAIDKKVFYTICCDCQKEFKNDKEQIQKQVEKNIDKIKYINNGGNSFGYIK